MILDSLCSWFEAASGGVLGTFLYELFSYAFGRAGSLLVILALVGLAILLGLDLSILSSLQHLWRWTTEFVSARREQKRIKAGPKIAMPAKPKPQKSKPVSTPATTAAEPEEEHVAEHDQIDVEEDMDQVWTLPPFSNMLNDHSEKQLDVDELREKARLIEETLKSLSIPGTVEEVNPGPTVTQYGIKPGHLARTIRGSDNTHARVKVSSIQNAANDLALALAAQSIRVEAPIPGKSLVGLEIPNKKPAIVGIRSILESEEMKKASPLCVALGRDVSGLPVIVDIANLPHLLIAGATGAGKSICINALITCLLCRNTPQDLRLLMVDPKRVELTGYNNVPHLLTDVVTEPDRVIGLLAWLVAEMEKRYQRLHDAGVRNIDGYNQAAALDDEKKMPYIICIIDELADLMMTASDQIEEKLCRIAQMARAVGIHLILATQRPSVDVLTGTIKANFSARLAFAVSSSTDSRVILDTPGAETLLGKGDSLYMNPQVAGLQRLQGCLVSDPEITQITSFWKAQKSRYLAQHNNSQTNASAVDSALIQQKLWPSINTTTESKQDEMFERALDIARRERSVSVSMLQRKLSIGYTRASRLVDQMEEDGIIGPYTTQNKPREVLLPPLEEKVQKGDS